MKRRLALALVMLGGLFSVSYAHDLFIKLDSYFVEPSSPVRIPVLNGVFDLSENAIMADRVTDISVVSPAGRAHIDTTAWAGDTAYADTTYLQIQTGDEGTYVVGASTRPRDLGLTGADFNEYLEHDGIPDVLEARRANNELDKDVWERYSKHVKAVFQVGDTRDRPKSWWQFWKKDVEPGYLTVLGYPAELVPLVNPYLLGPGDELQVQCLVDGEPVANQLVLAGGEGAAGAIEERSVRTNEEGIASFVLDAPGIWYVKFINMVPTAEEDLDYVSKWATLTFAVQ